MAAALLLGTAASIWQAILATAARQDALLSEEVAQDQKREADSAKQEAEKRRDELSGLYKSLRQMNYVADMKLARQAWDENNFRGVHELLERHRPKSNETDLRGFEWFYHRRQFHRGQRTIKAHPGQITMVAFFPNEKKVVSIGNSRKEPALNSPMKAPSEVKLWDVDTGRQLPLKLQGPTDRALCGDLSPDGKFLAAGCRDKIIRIWNLETGECFELKGHAVDLVQGVVFSLGRTALGFHGQRILRSRPTADRGFE